MNEYDCSGDCFVPEVTNMTLENVLAAIGIQSSQDDFNMLLLHPLVYNYLRKNTMIDFFHCPQTGVNIPFFGSFPVMFDSSLPREGNVFTSYLLAMPRGKNTFKSVRLITREA